MNDGELPQPNPKPIRWKISDPGILTVIIDMELPDETGVNAHWRGLQWVERTSDGSFQRYELALSQAALVSLARRLSSESRGHLGLSRVRYYRLRIAWLWNDIQDQFWRVLRRSAA